MLPTPGSQCKMAQPVQGKHSEQAIPREDNQPLRMRKKKGETETSPVHRQLLLPTPCLGAGRAQRATTAGLIQKSHLESEPDKRTHPWQEIRVLLQGI